MAQKSQTSFVEKITNAALWMPRQNLGRLLVQWEIFQRIQNVQGSIIECGVCFGGGVGAWQHFLAIADPYGHHRRVVGFDTFEGFAAVTASDVGAQSPLAHVGGMAAPVDAEIRALMELHDANRPIGHIPKVELVTGDACVTIPKYLEEHAQTVVALLVLDFDVAAPTKIALEHFVPRMPKGAVICWDELGVADWPGETRATLGYCGHLNDLRIERRPWASTISWAVLE